MNPAQITLVQQSFAKVAPIADAAAAMFYQRLFELDPALTKLFRGDMKDQGKKLMAMIAGAVRGLDRIDNPGAGGAQARRAPCRLRGQGEGLQDGRRRPAVDA